MNGDWVCVGEGVKGLNHGYHRLPLKRRCKK